MIERYAVPVALGSALCLAADARAASARDTAIEKALCAVPYEGEVVPQVCRLAELKAAGRDAAGHSLWIATLARSAAADFQKPHKPCRPYSYDLVVLDRDAVVRTQRLTNVCNDGLASEGCGEGAVAVKIAENRFERDYTDYYGCNVSRSHEVIQLAPLKVLSEESSAQRTAAGWSEESRYDWTTHAGTSARTQEVAEYEEDQALQKRLHARYGDVARNASVWIPRLDLGEAYSAGGWRALALGTCAARVDGAGEGFVIAGGEGGAANASFKVLATSRGELIVEVADGHVVSGAKSWLYEDHLELWLAASFAWDDVIGAEAEPPVPQQWGIRVSDGRVFAAHGKPTDTLAVERQEAKGTDGGPVVRFRMTLPSSFGRAPLVTVVYSDTNDGRTQERLLATSDLQFGRVWTLGELQPPRANRVRCGPHAGALDFDDAQAFAPARSVVSQ